MNKALVRILDFGGRGMNNIDLAEWIQWGEGKEHKATDIGPYHVGGKLAAIYLAHGIDIISRRAGEETLWRFTDPHWGETTALLEDSRLDSISWSDACRLVPELSRVPRGAGFTSVT